MVKLGKTGDNKAFFATPVAKCKLTPVFSWSKSWLHLKTVSSSDVHRITIRMVCTAIREYCPS